MPEIVAINGAKPGTDWLFAEDDEVVAPDRPAVFSLSRWLEAGGRGDAGLLRGVRLDPADDPALLTGRLDGVAMVALHFPDLNEGRPYSQARFLRAELGFGGEIRARGAVLADQLLFMARCGFDVFELAPGVDRQVALSALSAFDIAYQPALAAGNGDTLYNRLRAGRGA